MPDPFRDPHVRRFLSELTEVARAVGSRAAASPPPPPAPPPKHSVLHRLADGLEQARRITFSLFVIMIGLVLLVITARAAFEPVSVFDPIDVALGIHDINGKNLTERVVAQMHAMRRQAAAAPGQSAPKDERLEAGPGTYVTTPRFQALSSVTIPGAGLNMQSIVKLIQDLVNVDNVHVSGALTAQPSPTNTPLYTLELTYDHSGQKQIKKIQLADPDELVSAAAASILGFSDPSHLIGYYCLHKKWPELDTGIDHYVGTDAVSAKRETAVQSLISCGNTLYSDKHYDAAIEAFTRALKLKPDYAIVLNNRSNAYRHNKQYELALKDLDRAIKISPDYALAYRNRAFTYLQMNDNARSLVDLDRAVALGPNDPAAYNNRCWSRAIAGELKTALADCNEALRLRPNNASTLDSRAFVHLKLGDLDAAMADYQAALELDPKHVTSLFGRGVAKRRKGDAAAGDADIAAAKAIRGDVGDEFARFGISVN